MNGLSILYRLHPSLAHPKTPAWKRCPPLPGMNIAFRLLGAFDSKAGKLEGVEAAGAFDADGRAVAFPPESVAEVLEGTSAAVRARIVRPWVRFRAPIAAKGFKLHLF